MPHRLQHAGSRVSITGHWASATRCRAAVRRPQAKRSTTRCRRSHSAEIEVLVGP